MFSKLIVYKIDGQHKLNRSPLSHIRVMLQRLEAARRRHHCGGMGDKCRKRLEHLLPTGAGARKPENILAMFEAIKGRPPTLREIEKLHREIPVVRDAKP